MLADTHHLFGNDVPLLQLWNQGFFQCGKNSAARKLVLTHKVLVINRSAGSRNGYLTGLGKDGKLTGQNRGRRVSSSQQMTLRNAKHIAGLIQCDLDMRRTRIVLDPAVDIVAKDCHSLSGLRHIWIPCNSLIEISLEVIIKLIVFQKQGH